MPFAKCLVSIFMFCCMFSCRFSFHFVFVVLLVFHIVSFMDSLKRRDIADITELIMMRIFYHRPDHFLYRQYIAKNWFELLSKCILIIFLSEGRRMNRFQSCKIRDCKRYHENENIHKKKHGGWQELSSSQKLNVIITQVAIFSNALYFDCMNCIADIISSEQCVCVCVCF